MRPSALPLLLLVPLLLANADIPGPVRAMLDAAIAGGNPSEVAIVEKYARAAAPDSASEISAIANTWRAEREAARLAEARRAPPHARWTGNAELGGYFTTGNTDNVGASGIFDVQRETARWRNKLRLAVDYQKSRGLLSREHYLGLYEPNFKFSPRGYIYGAAQYESDRFLGYSERYSGSLGIGYNAIRQPSLTLDVNLGPAYRYTVYTAGNIESSITARGSLDLDLKLSRSVSLSQDASAYLQRFNSTVTSSTALNAKLIGPLAAKFSYNVQYESMPAAGRVGTDTTSRAALVYSF